MLSSSRSLMLNIVLGSAAALLSLHFPSCTSPLTELASFHPSSDIPLIDCIALYFWQNRRTVVLLTAILLSDVHAQSTSLKREAPRSPLHYNWSTSLRLTTSMSRAAFRPVWRQHPSITARQTRPATRLNSFSASCASGRRSSTLASLPAKSNLRVTSVFTALILLGVGSTAYGL